MTKKELNKKRTNLDLEFDKIDSLLKEMELNPDKITLKQIDNVRKYWDNIHEMKMEIYSSIKQELKNHGK